MIKRVMRFAQSHFILPLRLTDRHDTLEKQLHLLIRHYNAALPQLLLMIFVLYFALNNSKNDSFMQLWCGCEALITLVIFLHAKRYLGNTHRHQLSVTRRAAFWSIAWRAVDALVWSCLPWFALGTSSMAGDVLIYAVIAGMAGGAVSTLSPVLPALVAYVAPMLGLVAIKSWLMNDPAYQALAVMCVLYGFTLIVQAANNSHAIREHIEIGFELEKSHQKLRAIEHQQTIADERQRMVQDMHDGLGSSLVSALRVVEHGKLNETEVAQVLKTCIDDLKLAIDSMESVDADLLLLLATLRFRLEPRLKVAGVKLHWQVQAVPALTWLDQRNALHILRILQEAFTNIIKHTHATEICVATHTDTQHTQIIVSDNGAGFSLAEARQRTGKGLSNQQRRAEAIGASVSWDSAHTGTAFTLRVPISKKIGA
jgi:signal transduction histidine kinase